MGFQIKRRFHLSEHVIESDIVTEGEHYGQHVIVPRELNEDLMTPLCHSSL